ncbi:MerR family transcriptional regulator [Lactiplantibacillus pentosus]|uniref:MerR family transcriptional regulator n=2 Tax=Lactiplantibacillus pentosus TaxID=1589 RepID=A0ABD7IRU7_LACPE|nr:MerR family transcriptional regulator [Lactiplantibacillus pentosus]MCA1344071.1 MerR family transcriptional regulator [Lactiplantibacillus pentosus]MCJ8185983.1 MerR family transcriptional regulator [Lactiplantibacillus pentosus]MCT3303980.1 MerR family transcriptional regulator [Lactiplantibacillus pentosus]MCT3310245.1 MerR family transcriptional regulator [Lactiplantibacillus pentosus]PRO77961.1 MerR family transcriptional regulator [Lactiplantibacillus pentosus]
MNIDAVSKKFDLTKDTLRYWERLGLLPPVERNQSGYREYSEHDMNWVFYIKVLRNAGMTIEALIEFVKLYREGKQTATARKTLLIDQRKELLDKIAAIEKTVKYLNFKIDHFEDHTLNYEKEKLAYEEETK